MNQSKLRAISLSFMLILMDRIINLYFLTSLFPRYLLVIIILVFNAMGYFYLIYKFPLLLINKFLKSSLMLDLEIVSSEKFQFLFLTKLYTVKNAVREDTP